MVVLQRNNKKLQSHCHVNQRTLEWVCFFYCQLYVIITLNVFFVIGSLPHVPEPNPSTPPNPAECSGTLFILYLESPNPISVIIVNNRIDDLDILSSPEDKFFHESLVSTEQLAAFSKGCEIGERLEFTLPNDLSKLLDPGSLSSDDIRRLYSASEKNYGSCFASDNLIDAAPFLSRNVLEADLRYPPTSKYIMIKSVSTKYIANGDLKKAVAPFLLKGYSLQQFTRIVAPVHHNDHWVLFHAVQDAKGKWHLELLDTMVGVIPRSWIDEFAGKLCSVLLYNGERSCTLSEVEQVWKGLKPIAQQVDGHVCGYAVLCTILSLLGKETGSLTDALLQGTKHPSGAVMNRNGPGGHALCPFIVNAILNSPWKPYIRRRLR